MTFCAKAIMTPTSAASIGFMLPVTVPLAAAPPVSPKPENSTLPSERFMALAISCVSSVPAEPTTVPAMIIAALLHHEAFEGDRQAGEGVVHRDHDRHVGAADRQRHQYAEHQRQHEEQRDHAGTGVHSRWRSIPPHQRGRGDISRLTISGRGSGTSS